MHVVRREEVVHRGLRLHFYSYVHPRKKTVTSYQSWVKEALYSLVICYGHKRRAKEAAFEHAAFKAFHALLEEMMSFLRVQTKSVLVRLDAVLSNS